MTGDDSTHEQGTDSDTGGASVPLDWRDFGEPSSGVVEAVVRVTDRRATDLPPLHDAVETDALNSLLMDDERAGETPFEVTFSYAGHRITVNADGDVVVRAN